MRAELIGENRYSQARLLAEAKRAGFKANKALLDRWVTLGLPPGIAGPEREAFDNFVRLKDPWQRDQDPDRMNEDVDLAGCRLDQERSGEERFIDWLRTEPRVGSRIGRADEAPLQQAGPASQAYPC